MSALPLREAFKARKDKLSLWPHILLVLLDKPEPTEGLTKCMCPVHDS